MSTSDCASLHAQRTTLNAPQRRARTVVGLASLALAVLAAHRADSLGSLAAAGAGWFGASHLVAAATGYAGCPELGAIPSVLMRRDVHFGCIPWQIADRHLGRPR